MNELKKARRRREAFRQRVERQRREWDGNTKRGSHCGRNGWWPGQYGAWRRPNIVTFIYPDGIRTTVATARLRTQPFKLSKIITLSNEPDDDSLVSFACPRRGYFSQQE